MAAEDTLGSCKGFKIKAYSNISGVGKQWSEFSLKSKVQLFKSSFERSRKAKKHQITLDFVHQVLRFCFLNPEKLKFSPTCSACCLELFGPNPKFSLKNEFLSLKQNPNPTLTQWF